MGNRAVGLLAALLAWGAASELGAESAAAPLGVTQVPREKFVVYLFIGHSNMDGRARGDGHQLDPPRAWGYDLHGRRWVPARSVLVSRRGYGPALPFLEALAESHSELHFGIIQNARSAATIARRYRRGRAEYNQMITAAKAVREHAVIAGVVCMFGLVESFDASASQELASQFTQMIAEFREDLQMPELPFIISGHEVEAPGQPEHRRTVIEQLDKVVRENEHVVLVPTQGASYRDDYHFDLAGHRLWATRAAEAVSQNRWVASSASSNELGTLAQLHLASSEPADLQLIELDAQVTVISEPVMPANILPYKLALTCTQWRIESDHTAGRTGRLVTMHVVIEDGKLLDAAGLKVGDARRLRLSPWSAKRDYHGHMISDDIAELDEPIWFIESMSAPEPDTLVR